MTSTRIVLTGVEKPLIEAWQQYCGDLPNVSVHYGSIFDVSCDAVVSPANSYGFMDGGIDFLYSQHFGWHVQERLQARIREKHYGELLVGTAEIVETDDSWIPFVIAAPTMRVPMILTESVNPYLAARAVLLLVTQGVFDSGIHAGEPIRDHIGIVAFPGLGTGVGRVAPEICAQQVRAAIDSVLTDSPSFPTSWRQAQLKHQELYSADRRDLQFE